MHSFADAVIVLWGWRRALVAFLAGAASAFAFAPFDLFPILWVTVPVFVWLLDGATGSAARPRLFRLVPAAVVGWWFGFGFFLSGLWWVGAAFLVEAEQFAWLMPFGVLALPAGLALFWAFGAALARALWSDGWARLFALAAAMTLAEWLRGTILTGFPWNAFGYALAAQPLTMQLASVIGIWGLTLLAFLIFGAPVLFVGGLVTDRRSRFLALAAIILVVLGGLGFGVLRLRGAEGAFVDGVQLRLVQPAVDQREKWQPGSAAAIMERYLALSASGETPLGRDGGPTHLIWPESAFPFLLTERPDALAAIAGLLPEGTTLITGAARGERPIGPGARPMLFNSVYVIDDGGEIRDAYDKVHLVPFGEYLPFEPALSALGLRQVVDALGTYSPGPRRRTIALADAPAFTPLICYEAIFSGSVTEPGNRPGWLVNVTNDAWFTVSGWWFDLPGPYQHLRHAQLRAVEEGLPLARAANTGISAIIDPYGRIVSSLALGEAGVVDGPLPASLPPTLFARFGGVTFWALLLATFCVAVGEGFTLRSGRQRQQLT
ncbi:MAG: apolipoprotein N-acyltransferase [Bauldia sp.]|nr:apolipoprotein N-acyltransferase [Bauldia sp.]